MEKLKNKKTICLNTGFPLENKETVNSKLSQRIVTNIKLPYVSPKIEISYVKPLDCISTTSARISGNSDIQQSWEIEDDDARDIVW